MGSQFYAHSNLDSPGTVSAWEPLFTPDCPALAGTFCPDCEALTRHHGHLNKVAWWAAKFVEGMFAAGSPEAPAGRQWGYLAGLWHDLGKFAPAWQDYLARKGGVDTHGDELGGKVDHATAGARHAVNRSRTLGHLLAYAIAGHHSGLLDALAENACQEKRLAKPSTGWEAAVPASLLQRAVPPLPPSIVEGLRPPQRPFVPALFTRLLFSALVDADFLATEAFMNPAQRETRPRTDATLLPRMLALLEGHHARFDPPVNQVDHARAAVRAACVEQAALPPGLFSLTVPTGGGKTLSSLAFALRHALAHGQQRVIYVIPFTSIIDQNARVFEEIFQPLADETGTPVVVQHHSNFAPKDETLETTRSRLAAENWDAPLVVTTAVQFYESLHAARTSSCRKLHRIANAVVILDEAQCLPVEYLHPCLDVLRELTAHYRTTAVLCTATQPEVGRSEEFPIGLEGVREIIPQPAQLYEALRRVEVIDRDHLDDATLAREIAACDQALAIVNTRGHAQGLFRLLPEGAGNFHLSALMCPAHREEVLAKVRARLDRSLPVRLISTQLIEAGVDVDFPRVYRTLAGIDSLAQAAGRCNRNGRQPTGELHVFRSEHQRAEAYFRDTAQLAEQVIERHRDDVLGLASVERFFKLYYQQHRPPEGQPWDAKSICADYRLEGSKPELPFQFQYQTVARKFRLIEDAQTTVLIPFDERAKSLLAELRNEAIPLNRKLLRGLQRYAVQVREHTFKQQRRQFESVRGDQFYILTSTDINYSEQFGLRFGDNSALLYAGDDC